MIITSFFIKLLTAKILPNFMNFLWKYLKEHKNLLFLALGLAAINQIFSLLDPQIFRLIIDNYASKVATMSFDMFLHGILLLLLASVGVAMISRIAKNFQDYYVNVITQKIGTEMYSRSVKHTLSLPYSVFEDQQSGAILQKLQKARADTQIIIASLVNTVFLSIIGISFVLVYAFTVHWIIGVVYLSLIPILGVFAFYLSKSIKVAQKEIVKQLSEMAGSTTETLRNVELVKSLGLDKQEIKRLNDTNERILELELKKVKIVRKNSFIQGTTINALRSGLLLLMLYLIFNNAITLGQFFSLFIYSFFIFGPLADFGTVASQYQEAKAANEQIDQILDIPPEKKPKNAKKTGRLREIVFKNVGFHYGANNTDSLKDVNISIRQGTTVAFAGPSGSGKTTMMKLLVGLYKPSKGKILLNDIDSLHVDYDDMRKKLGLVSQETQLFAGTIRENLLFVNPKATDKECMAVLKLAAATTIMDRADQGLDTRIGEGGIKISGGERQRLAIARALLRNPEIVIFDEATSSLDSITEKAITKTIQDIRRSRPNMIIVLVAHRLSTIAHADTIYVLEKGKVIESGNHKQLLQKKGLYAAFWREQSSTE
jgi:ATP-binding cassette subfamily B protein